MMEWFVELKENIDRHGIRWGLVLTLYAVYRKERRNMRLDQRDAAMFHNQKVIMDLLGVGDQWHGQVKISSWDQPNYKQLYSSLRKETQRVNRKRRMSMLTNLFKTSVSKKLTALLLGAAVAILNKKLHLDLTPDELLTFLIVVGGYILGQSHVDARKVTAGIKDSPLLQMGFTEAIPILSEIHASINNILADVKKNDGSQAYKDAMQAYAQIKPILDALKHPEPLAVIVEDKVAS